MSKVNKLGQYKDIEVNVEKHNVTEEELEQQLAAFVAQNPTFVEKDGPVENGDVTTLDFEGFKDGVAFEGGKAENHQLEIGSGQFIPGFEEQMIGMSKGETRELNLTFPENYGAADLAGADVVFKVTVHKIENKKDSQLDDEFVASLNIPNLSTVDQLREQMKNQIQGQHDQQYQAQVENSIFQQLIEACEVEVEKEDIDRALNLQIQHMQMELARQGLAFEQYLQMMGTNEEAFRQQIEPNAKQQAIFEAVIDAIVEAEAIEATQEEIDQQLDMIAAQNQMTKEQVLEKVNMEDLKHDFSRVKASQFVLNSAKIK